MSRSGVLLALCSFALFGGCLSSTDGGPSSIRLAGQWNYVGLQTGAVREDLSGELSVLGESGTTFQGRLNIVAVNEATGESRVLEGSVSGASEGQVVDFDANVEGGTRRHVGQIVADTITGTWVGSSSGGTMSSGTFRAERESQ